MKTRDMDKGRGRCVDDKRKETNGASGQRRLADAITGKKGEKRRE